MHRLVATRVAPAQRAGRLLWLLGRAEAISAGTPVGRCLRSAQIVPWHGSRVPHESAQNGTMWWPQKCAQRRGGDRRFGRKV